MGNGPRVSGSLSARLIRSTTGRSSQVLQDDEPTLYGAVEKFARRLCDLEDWSVEDLLEREEIVVRLMEEIRSVRQIGLTGHYFRGRTFDPGGPDPASHQFGPPPSGTQPVGRYNQDGVASVLYLSSSEEACAAELTASSEMPLYIQAFDINAEDVGVVRLEPDLQPQAPTLHDMLMVSEVVPQPDSDIRNFQNPYRMTHLIRALCETAEIGAIEFPSIRAGSPSGTNAVNLVVLAPHIDGVLADAVGQPFVWPKPE